MVFLCAVDGGQCTVLVWLDRKAGSESGKERKGRPVGTEIPPALFCSDGGTSGSSCSVRQCPEYHQLPGLPHVEKNGWAQAYGAGWEERIAVLKDDSVKNPVFRPLNYVELLMYTDLQPENGYVWVNTACAEYYGKESVTVTTGTTGE